LRVGQIAVGRDDGGNAQRMPDKDHRACRHDDLALKRCYPVLEDGCIPLALFDESCGPDLVHPAVLPMARTGMAKAGNDKDISVCGFHARALMEIMPLCWHPARAIQLRTSGRLFSEHPPEDRIDVLEVIGVVETGVDLC